MREQWPELRELGVDFMAITPEPVELAAKMKNDMQLPFTFLSDPQLDVIRAFGIFHEDEPKGRILPYPATYLIGHDGLVKWRHIGRETRDRPKPHELKEAIMNFSNRSPHHTLKGEITMSNYTHPEVLVDTQWVADHVSDPKLRLVEVDVDTTAYDSGHIAGAVGWNWRKDTQQQVNRDIPDQAGWGALLSHSGIANDTTIIFYGDNNNWFATFAFWLSKIYGHEDARLMNGGRKKWIDEGRPLTTEPPQIRPTQYKAKEPDMSLRAARDLVSEYIAHAKRALVDVRSPREYSGELLAPENLPQEGAQRGGHIPGAANIPWGMAVKEDGTFKPVEELQALYGGKGVTKDKEIIAYCRIGERSSHTWFVLKYLLGYPHVRNYDGSWTEWGSLIGAPIEK